MSKLNDILYDFQLVTSGKTEGRRVAEQAIKDLFSELIDDVVDDSFYSEPLKQKVAEL